MNPRYIIIGSFAVTLGYICYVDITKCKEAPWPPRIIGTGIVFGMIDLFSNISDELASVFAIGFLLATIIQKGFKPVCGPHPCATAQPTSYNSLQNSQGAPGGQVAV